MSTCFALRLILACEHLAFYISFPSVALLALDETNGLLQGEGLASQRVLLYGILITVYPLLQIFAAPFVGRRLDERPKKLVLQLIHFAGFIGYVLIAASAWTKMTTLAVMGLAIPSAVGAPLPIIKALAALASDKQERLKEFSKIALVKGASSLVGPFLGFWIVTMAPSWGYIAPLATSALLSLVGLLLTNRLIGSTKEPSSPSVPSFGTLFPPRELLVQQFPMLLGLFCFAGGYCTFLKFVPVVWSHDVKEGLLMFSSFSAFVGFSTLLNQLFISRWIQLSPKLIPTFARLLCLGLFCLCMSPFTLLSWVGLLLILFCYSLLITCIETKLSLSGMEKTQGRIQGMLYSIENCSYLVGPGIAAWVASFEPLYSLYFILILACVSAVVVHSSAYYNVSAEKTQLE